MAISLERIVLTTQYYTDENGRHHALREITELQVDAADRAGFEASGKPYTRNPLPETLILLMELSGGNPGQVVKITGTLNNPAGEPDLFLPTFEFTWGPKPVHSLIIRLTEGDILFSRSAIYRFSFLADAIAIGDLPLAVRWSDEPPL